MKTSKLIQELEKSLERNGDLEVVMQATLLENGFSRNKDCVIEDVFVSTVETAQVVWKEKEPQLQIFWQM